jgi:hypothetical protein
MRTINFLNSGSFAINAVSTKVSSQFVSEITEAFSCVIELRNEWYKLPSDDKPKKDEDGEKN